MMGFKLRAAGRTTHQIQSFNSIQSHIQTNYVRFMWNYMCQHELIKPFFKRAICDVYRVNISACFTCREGCNGCLLNEWRVFSLPLNRTVTTSFSKGFSYSRFAYYLDSASTSCPWLIRPFQSQLRLFGNRFVQEVFYALSPSFIM